MIDERLSKVNEKIKWGITVVLAVVIGVFTDRYLLGDVSLLTPEVFWPSCVIIVAAFCKYFLMVWIIFNFKSLRTKMYSIVGFVALIGLEIVGVITDFGANSSYVGLNFFVIVVTFSFLIQTVISSSNLKQVKLITLSWMLGIFIYPFSLMLGFFNSVVKFFKKASDKNGLASSTIKKVMIGLLISLPLIVVILLLLMTADPIYSQMLTNLIPQFNFSSFIAHIAIILLLSASSYSVLYHILPWSNNTTAAQLYSTDIFGSPTDVTSSSSVRDDTPKEELPNQVWEGSKGKTHFDLTISTVVLVVVELIYISFCTVQFAFLFGLTGLPDGFTYSSYAVQGFWQIVIITLINLAVFGLLLIYTELKNWFKGLLVFFVVLTAVLLVSAAVRLSLYIDVYGFTWLRLLSSWFLIFLAVFLILAAVRLFIEQLPLIAIGFMVGIFWWLILGIANPAKICDTWNETYHPNAIVLPD
ncbi:hypothetical protein FACS1894125_3220 [Actinomycetota bacterium]|nr:hypothetical protein FACS1894125_3220 [Actinomycetota bacterium]